MRAVLKRMNLKVVPRGFRSTFRDRAAELANYPRDVTEMALAHATGDKAEAACRRGDLFGKRRRMMADGAKFRAAPSVRTGEVLDFDGVTHPECCETGQFFSRTAFLWQILRACPEVLVVFSISWKSICRPDEMIDFATCGGGEDWAHRFVGSTPSIIQTPGANIADRVFKREAE